MEGTNMSFIRIADRNGDIHNWKIEEDKGNGYSIVCNGYVSAISKDKIFVYDGVLLSDEIRNPFCTIENKRYSKAAFFKVWLED